MPDNSYWQERQEQKYLIAEKKIDAYYEGLKRSFEQAKKEIHSVIADFYMRYADENGLTFTEAQKALSKAEIGSLKAFISKVNRHMGEYSQELNNMSIKARMSPYQATEMQIDAILQELYTIEYKIKGEELFKEIYEDSYYRTWFNIDQYHGFHQEFAQIASSVVEELVKYPFNGANFSSRLWKQKDHMLQRLNESLTTMLVQGKNPKTLSDGFSKAFGTKEFEAYRLLHTEGSFMSEQGTLAAYKEDGVDRYQFLATLDGKTSDICREADGEIYEVERAVVGVNYPPLHNFCRSTTVPYYEDGVGGARAARDPVTGKPYKVPADMTYKNWHTEYIAGNPEAVLTEQKWKNRYTDKKQYEKYKEILGVDAPKTFDSFQNLKYTETEKWAEIKDRYDNTRLGKYLQNQFAYTYNGEKLFIPNNTIFEATRVIAGGKSKTPLRVKEKLSEKYGGTPEDWVKRVGKIESDNYVFDMHWYELKGKQYEMKLKNRGEKK